ncbi:MAG: hypothetical protein AAB834_02395 [Patescibacteria group bacterium]
MFFGIACGSLVGWIAAILQEGNTPKRIATYIVAGAVGGLLGGYGGGLLGAETLRYSASAADMMFAIFGAAALVMLTSFAVKQHP